MSHILHFDIRGLNGRKKPIAYTLHRHVNVFFGSNGSGKTSILRIINSAMNVDASSINSIEFTGASVTIHTIKYKQQLVYTYKRPHLSATRGVVTDPSGVDDLFPDATEIGSERPGTWKTKDHPTREEKKHDGPTFIFQQVVSTSLVEN